MSSLPGIDLGGLQTEVRNPLSTQIDQVSTLELCQILNAEDTKVPKAVGACIPIIAAAIDALSTRVRQGGRVFYIGAGTSGRLGVLDASEIPPTYSAPPGQFVALIAGGDTALRHAKEGAEDDRNAAEAELKSLDFNPKVDSLIGIASSGRTPYMLGGLAFVRSVGGTTVAVVCVDPSEAAAEGNVDYLIKAVSGPEVVTGSTRMKAGTATKLVLNMISTGIMIKLGKTYGNLMIDLKASNDKLKQRSKNILRMIAGPDCGKSDEELETILEACHGKVKLAAVTLKLGISPAEAEEQLEKHGGILARVLADVSSQPAQRENDDGHIVLCVDAGGTSCDAVVLTSKGSMGRVNGGPCNISSMGLDAALSTISGAIQQAIDNCDVTRERKLGTVRFSSVWIGMAGIDRPAYKHVVGASLSNMLNMPLGSQLRVTTDIDMLPAVITQGREDALVLVAGTGSIAMSYTNANGEFRRTNRAGGWGRLLGDDGSGYAIGREALRLALQSAEACRMYAGPEQSEESLLSEFSLLSRAIFTHFQSEHPGSQPQDLLEMVLAPDEDGDTARATVERIASVAKVVLSLALSDPEAQRITEDSIASLVRLVSSLTKVGDGLIYETVLVLAGGLMQDSLYRARLISGLRAGLGVSFSRVESVEDPAGAVAAALLEKLQSRTVYYSSD